MTTAIILVGGKGKRLLPYTTILPKPMMPIRGRPILESVIRRLRINGITDIILAVGYMSYVFKVYFGDGKNFGVNIGYSEEDNDLGTAGPIRSLLSDVSDDFLVLNGDILTNFNYNEFMKYHVEHENGITIAAKDEYSNIKSGVLVIDKETSNLIHWYEKPETMSTISIGINTFNKHMVKNAFSNLPDKCDIPDLVMSYSKYGNISVFKDNSCDWIDIGTIDDYIKSEQLLDRYLEKWFQEE